jgi:hypothetical protein
MSGPDAAAWLLTAAERGNPATAIDAARTGGRAWTAGNLVRVHVDGAAYFAGDPTGHGVVGPHDGPRTRRWNFGLTQTLCVIITNRPPRRQRHGSEVVCDDDHQRSMRPEPVVRGELSGPPLVASAV